MNYSATTLRRLVVAGGIALAVPLVGHAQEAPDDFAGLLWGPLIARGPGPEGPMFMHGPGPDRPMFARGPGPDGPMFGPGAGAPMGPDRGGGASGGRHRFAGPEDTMPMLPLLRGLALTEAQSDKVFAILHAQAPLLREKAKAARHAYDDLQQLAVSPQFDPAKARALADTGARAQADLAMLRADGEHQIFMVLTEEQREEVSASRRSRRRP